MCCEIHRRLGLWSLSAPGFVDRGKPAEALDAGGRLRVAVAAAINMQRRLGVGSLRKHSRVSSYPRRLVDVRAVPVRGQQ